MQAQKQLCFFQNYLNVPRILQNTCNPHSSGCKVFGSNQLDTQSERQMHSQKQLSCFRKHFNVSRILQNTCNAHSRGCKVFGSNQLDTQTEGQMYSQKQLSGFKQNVNEPTTNSRILATPIAVAVRSLEATSLTHKQRDKCIHRNS